MKQQTDDSLKGRLRFWPAFFRIFAALFFTSLLFHCLSYSLPEEEKDLDAEQVWQAVTNSQFEDRLEWLQWTAIISPGGASLYRWYAEAVVSTLHHKKEKKATTADLVDLNGIYASISRAFTSLWLRLGFVFIAFWPLWIIGGVAGYLSYRKKFAGKRTEDLLGICDRGRTPFYSGIYGPLRPNNSFSATDLTCPGLACPNMVPPETALSHPMAQILKNFGAMNQTNLDLVRVILEYKDFPSFVESEQAAEEEPEQGDTAVEKAINPYAAFITNANGTIESSAQVGLEAALSAHQVLKQYVLEAQRRNLNSAQLSANFGVHREILDPLLAQLSAPAKLLANSLTPYRAWALGHVHPAFVSSACLSIEAGKCLVYRRDGKNFSRISRFPHLQARAILQSLVNFGREYNGDTRLVLRQAIICSRRHGDFGRSFLPDKMPIESRALRDWLEILYAEPAKREISGHLVEQDAHLEELNLNFRSVYSRRLRQSLDVSHAHVGGKKETPFWKGIVYKSVVLVPLAEVVNMTLRAVDDMRIKRIADLLNLTRRYQTSISISARLPGFKRQAIDAENTFALLTPNDPQKPLLERWHIVRRVLTRYNWLSTRIGDDAVPPQGYVHGLVISTDPEGGKPELSGFDMLVPVRQRRYDEMFGKSWEGTFFIDSPHPNNVRVFVDNDAYHQSLKREQETLKKLTPITAANKLASA